MKIIDNFLNDTQIQELKNVWDQYKDRSYINWETDDGYIDRRLTISDQTLNKECDDIYNNILKLVKEEFPNCIDSWFALQEQRVPHNIHIDDYGSDTNGKRYTYIIALDSVPEFKAIAWKETAWDNNKLHEFVQQWGKLRPYKKKKSNISEVEDLEHTIDKNNNSYMCDYLELDGIFEYKKGSACLFDATQLHCSSNWVKYPQHKTRQLLQIHVLT